VIKKKMKKIVAMLMAMILVMSVTVAVAGSAATTREEQAEKVDLQIFEKELNVPGEEDFILGEILVRFKPGVGKDKINKINSKHGALVRYASPYSGTKRIAIPEGKTVPEMVNLYQAEDAVVYAKPNYICRASFVPGDPYYSYQWHFPLINMPSAWDIQLSGDPEIVVAVLDTGVAYEDYVEFVPGPGRRTRSITYAQAPDLAGTSFAAGYDFINNDEHPNDDNAHGTHVTGTIAQTTDNGYGVAGMAFGTSIMPVKVLGKDGIGTDLSLADGICYAADNGAAVISMSLSFGSGLTPGQIPDVTEAVAYAYDKGVILVASSGNEGVGVVSLPAAYPQVIAVGAVHSGDERASYSQYGDALEVVAPGGDDVDRDNNDFGDYVVQETFPPEGDPTVFGIWGYTGTSMAAPHVSGLIALLLAQDSTRTQDEIREILHTTSVDLGASDWDVEYGYGRIDALAALQWTATLNDPPVANDQSVTTDEDTSVSITLTATDSNNDLLTYSIDSGPLHGMLTGTAPSVTYTPNDNYNGGDSFTFKANDGKVDSNIATVTITVSPVNDAPVANDQSVTTIQDTPVDITLTASDVDNDPLTYSIDSVPSNGVLTGSAPDFTYTPDDNYNGDDSFTFEANDGKVDSNIATVSITVNSAAPTMHVASIDMSWYSRSAGRNTFVWAVAAVTIVDDSDPDNPVEGATVSGYWSGATSDIDSGMTDDMGQVSLKSDSVKNPLSGTTFTFTVDGVAKEGWTYDSSANVETSDRITV
jgi:serine protease